MREIEANSQFYLTKARADLDRFRRFCSRFTTFQTRSKSTILPPGASKQRKCLRGGVSSSRRPKSTGKESLQIDQDRVSLSGRRVAPGQQGFRRLAVIRYPKVAPGFGSDLADSIEASPAHPALEALAPPWASQNRRNSTATSRILRLRIGQMWPEDGMRDGILHCGHAPNSHLRWICFSRPR